MNVANERQWDHAHAVRARGSAMPADGMPGADILDSWVRCMRGGLDIAAAAPVAVVEAADLARRRDRAQTVRRLARIELETLAQQIAGSNFLLAFADPEGVILDLFADNRFEMSNSRASILAGSCWGEALCGTNGVGTALATGRSVAVTGLEHYFLELGDISCTAAPVRDAYGEIVGALDAASYFESRQRHTQALVQMAATHLENGLLVHQMRHSTVLAIHPRREFLVTLSAGLLAFDGEGRLQAINARGRQLLQGLDGAPGVSFEALFGDSFEQVLARLQRGGDLHLRDRLGSTLVATCISRPVATGTASGAVGGSAARPAGEPAADPAPLPPRPPGPKAGHDAHRAALHAPPHAAPQATHAERRGRGAAASPPGSGSDSAPRGFVADDPAVVEAMRLVEGAVRLNAPILIHGETGSGKELLSRHAHAASGRAGSFVAVNCGALPAELFEAELFGYVGGAFTGARREGSLGLIASADSGTLLLDEVRELSPHLQAALLRFLDDQVVRPVGGTNSRRVDVQLLAATSADLEDEVAARRFRADLLYRLNTVRVTLPPLRHRQDFSSAVQHTLAALDHRATIDADAVLRLAAHPWPGNFRELRSVLTRALLHHDGNRHLTRTLVDSLLPATPGLPGGRDNGAPCTSALQQSASDLVRREFERTGHSVSQTSRNLGVSRTTVYRHLREVRA